jgi:hypothetical protein
MKYVLIFSALLVSTGWAQNITSITCNRSWTGTIGNNCYSSSSNVSGAISCGCSAQCGSTCEELDAHYKVHWAMAGNATGTGIIDGHSESSSIVVNGSLLLTCGLQTYGDQGYDRHNCDGNRSTVSFNVSCPGGSGTGSQP